MDYFSEQQYLSELVESGLLEMATENNSTRYTITSDGEDTLNYFIKHISNYAKSVINNYAKENSKRLRGRICSNRQLFSGNEQRVYCKMQECMTANGATSLMEISINVATKDQARTICRNWKNNVADLYGEIMLTLATDPDNKSDPKPITIRK